MTPERWRRVETLFHAARSRGASERRAFLAEACADDPSLQREVESLLAGTAQGAIVAAGAAALAALHAGPNLIGRQFGDYRIQARLGAGGMGEVYRAHDVRLRRDVAVKVLPRLLMSDPERLSRFEREARTLAALNHPHIGAIYGVVEIDGAPALILELVDGETLAERIARGPIPPEASVAIARQLVDALSAAHAKGIVHRDLKPANVKVTPGSLVKVLDFGLAKAVGTAPSDELTGSPAVTGTATRLGVIVGTAAYMSPEQARGQRIDDRTDVWAFGCVLFEMLSGRKAFAGDSIADVLAGVLEREPDWSALPAATPASVRQVVARCLEKDVDRRLQDSAAIAAALSQPERPASTMWRSATPRVVRRVAAAAIALGLLLLGWTFYPTSPQAKTLAILPFVNESGNADLEYLSDGITESLINAMSQVPALTVTSRTSVFRLKSTAPDVKAAAKTLNADAVLVGRVGQRGDQLLVSVQLEDATGRALWGESYHREFRELFAVQEVISTEITGALRLELTGEERQRLTRRYTDNTEAYRLYLQGRYQWNKKTEEGFRNGIALFEQAIRADSGYAPAYAAVAALYNNLANYNFAIFPPKRAWQEAQNNAQMAVRLDDTLASAHASLALVAYQWEWDWSKAEREFKRSLALDSTSPSNLEPSPASTHHWYSHYLLSMGRVDESLQEGQRALALDPLDLANNAHKGWHFLFTREYDRALEPLRTAIDMGPAFPVSRWYRGMVFEQQHAYDQAIAEFAECVRLTGDRPSMLALLGHAYAADGRRSKAEEILVRLLAVSTTTDQYVAPYPIAVIYAALNDREHAFEWLERAYNERDSWLNYLGLDPRLDGLRGEAQFADLMGRLNLPTVKPRQAGID